MGLTSDTPARTAAAPLQVPAEEAVLATLRPGHPRLLLLPDDLARIRRLIGPGGDATAQRYYGGLRQMGEALLAAAPLERVLDGLRPELLFVGRQATERLSALGLLYHLDRDRRWAARAAVEMRALAAFEDWHPSHFLDVAELSHAMAIGYDWLFDALSPEDRATAKTALLEKGLRSAEHGYRAGAAWVTRTSNWNNVCNGGIATAALALADEEPELCRFLVRQALLSVPRALATYAPDGAWPEGPGYWSYATRYTVLLLAGLRSALGTDFGLSALPGLAETGVFRVQSEGPTGLLFNFADAHDAYGDEPSRSRPALFWLARRYDHPLLAHGARRVAADRVSARDLLWYDPRGTADDLVAVPLDVRYERAHVAYLRASWTDPDALYVGFKGNGNAVGHAHLDAGSFVLDACGQRWACDLGTDHYSLPGYFDFADRRWTYYRMGTHGHNTVVLGGRHQAYAVEAPLVAFGSTPAAAFAVADLTAAYAPSGATRVWRGVGLIDGRTAVLVRDEIETAAPVDVTWTMHTYADVAVDVGVPGAGGPGSGGTGAGSVGTRAVLTQGSACLEARLLAPPDARFSVEEVDLQPPHKPSPGLRKLVVRLPAGATATPASIAVLLTPGAGSADAAESAAAELGPLHSWGSFHGAAGGVQ